jgi:quinol monooxygenase YgiN
MAQKDKCCTIVPYFKIAEGKLQDFRKVAERCVEQTQSEPGCFYYGFTYSGNEAHCREGYRDGDAAIAHVENVGPLLGELLKLAQLTKLEFHGPAEELEKLRGPLAHLNAQYFVLECGFRN